MSTEKTTRDVSAVWAIVIAGLGFFIDSFDAFTYNVMRVPSLTELGLSGDALTRTGLTILNMQITGVFLGGFLWGLLGDKVGRKKALLGSILFYSAGMIINAFCHDTTIYGLSRFMVGLGIAGEVGLGATLIGEILPKGKRVFGLAFFTLLGLAGVVAAALSIEFVSWRTLCLMGGISGLALLVLRHLLLESPLFTALPAPQSFLAPLKAVLSSRRLCGRYLGCIFLLAPNFLVTAVFLTLAPEVGAALGLHTPIKANLMLAGCFAVSLFGDFFGAFLTQQLRSRRKALALFMVGLLATGVLYLTNTFNHLYLAGALFGLFNLWALSSTVAVEQFPTAMRATLSTSVLTLARTMIIPFNLSILWLKPMLGLIPTLSLIGIITIALGLLSTYFLRETHDVDLETIEL